MPRTERRAGPSITIDHAAAAGVRQMRLDDKIRTVVGIMPPRFMWRGAPMCISRSRFTEDKSWRTYGSST
jgi:hypothetical protein